MASPVSSLGSASPWAGARLVVMLLPVSLRPMDLRFVVGSSFEGRFPTPDGPFTFRAAEPRDRLVKITSEVGVELFDPSGDWVRLIEERQLVKGAWEHPGDPHLSDVGDDVIAELMQRWLVPQLAAGRAGG